MKLARNEYSSNNAQIHNSTTGFDVKINSNLLDAMGASPMQLVELINEHSNLSEFLESMPYQELRSDWEDAMVQCHTDVKAAMVLKCLSNANEWVSYI